MLTAALLGLFHGVNPAMGWLFAVFLAWHRKDRPALFRSMIYLALGHAAAVAVVFAILVVAGTAFSLHQVQMVSAVTVLLFGLYRLFRYYRHMNWASLNVSYRDLFVWSFLAATSHGSGLMLAPLVAGAPEGGQAVMVLTVHSVAAFLGMLGIAVWVHDKIGVNFLRKMWLNFDLLWGAALVLAGAIAVWEVFGSHAGHVHM
ncbi:MAG: hypothetical protein ACOY93_19600 [Bacillota bacterium]